MVCGLGVGAHLERWGYPPERIVEVDWGDSLALPRGLSLHAATARHFSGRGLRSGRSLWCSYVLKSPRRSLFLGGDGGYGKHLADIGAQYGPFDLALVEQGQYNPGWRQIHLLPTQLSGTMHDLRATRLLPVHNSKFPLAYHRWSEPLDSAETTARRDGFTLLTPKIGEVLPLDSTPTTGRWWKAPVPTEPPPSRDR